MNCKIYFIVIGMLAISNSLFSEISEVEFIKKIVSDHCLKCHCQKVSKGKVRLDLINFDKITEHDLTTIQDSLDQIILEDMPPPKKSKLAAGDREKLHTILTKKMQEYHSSAQDKRPFQPAKLTKRQLVFSLEKLLQVKAKENLVFSLPDDKNGDPALIKNKFNNDRNMQKLNILQFELFRNLIKDMLDRALPDQEPKMRPFEAHYFDFRYESKSKKINTYIKSISASEKHIKSNSIAYPYKTKTKDSPANRKHFSLSKTKTSPMFNQSEKGISIEPYIWKYEVGRSTEHHWGPNAVFTFPHLKTGPGSYKITLIAAKQEAAMESPKLVLFHGPQTYFTNSLLRKSGPAITLHSTNLKEYSFWVKFDESQSPLLLEKDRRGPLGFQVRNENFRFDKNVDFNDSKKDVPVSPLLIKGFKLEGPYYSSWPMKRENSLLLVKKKNTGDSDHAKLIIRNFLEKAFRNFYTLQDVANYHRLWQSIFQKEPDFRKSIKETFLAILLSPKFLFVDIDSQRPLNLELATKLAFFLWDSPPEKVLLDRSNNKEWLPEDEITYLTKDPRFYRFTENFVKEWLALEEKQDEFFCGREVNKSLAKEPAKFIQFLFQNNLSLVNIIDSDFLVVDQNLARWYSIPLKLEGEFQYVKLPKGSIRGGLLTMSAIIRSNSKLSGVSDPIKRGAWLCERILGRHLPPPPMNVEFPNPDDFKDFDKLTVTEQLKFHQENKACYGCHRRIDPFGLPFEELDGYGLKRDKNYTFELTKTKKGKPFKNLLSNVESTSYIKGDKVEGVQSLKHLLVKKYTPEVMNSFVEFLFSYAIGRELSLSEKLLVKKMSQAWAGKNYQSQELLKIILRTDQFYNPRKLNGKN